MRRVADEIGRADQTREAARILAEASNLLASSLDYEATLAGVAQLFHCAFVLRLVAPPDHDARAFFGARRRHAQPDAAVAARDQDDAVSKSTHAAELRLTPFARAVAISLQGSVG